MAVVSISVGQGGQQGCPRCRVRLAGRVDPRLDNDVNPLGQRALTPCRCRCTSSWGASIAACWQREQLRLGGRAAGLVRAGGVQAGGRPANSTFVHEPVDDLCKKAASLWVWGEMLGIGAASRAYGRAVTWEKPFTPCAHKGGLALST